ncbi:MAG: hypothetical protein AAGC77_09680 [Pseudomonadota bacterium]
MTDGEFGGVVMMVAVIVILALIWRTVALIIGLLICSVSTWNLSTQMYLMEAQGSEDLSALFTAFIGLLFILRYRVKRPDHDDRVYETGTGTYYSGSGTFVRNYSTGLGRALGTTLIGGMIIIVVLAAILSGIRFG